MQRALCPLKLLDTIAGTILINNNGVPDCVFMDSLAWTAKTKSMMPLVDVSTNDPYWLDIINASEHPKL